MVWLYSYHAGFFLQKRWLSIIWFWNQWPTTWSTARLQNRAIWWWDSPDPYGWNLCQVSKSFCKCRHSIVWGFQTAKLWAVSSTFCELYWYRAIIYRWGHICLISFAEVHFGGENVLQLIVLENGNCWRTYKILTIGYAYSWSALFSREKKCLWFRFNYNKWKCQIKFQGVVLRSVVEPSQTLIFLKSVYL